MQTIVIARAPEYVGVIGVTAGSLFEAELLELEQLQTELAVAIRYEERQAHVISHDYVGALEAQARSHGLLKRHEHLVMSYLDTRAGPEPLALPAPAESFDQTSQAPPRSDSRESAREPTLVNRLRSAFARLLGK